MGETQAERIVRVYTDLLVDSGVRQATIDAVSKRCGLTRAGLLHHHRSRVALDAALLERLRALVDEDVASMAAASEGAAAYYLSSSFAADSALERTVAAATRLAQAGSASAAGALREARGRWLDLLEAELGDVLVAKLVLLAGDGVGHQVDIRAGLPADAAEFVDAEEITALGAMLSRLSRS